MKVEAVVVVEVAVAMTLPRRYEEAERVQVLPLAAQAPLPPPGTLRRAAVQTFL